MAITTLRPNGTDAGSTGYTIGGGAGSMHAATNDNSDVTFIDAAPSTTVNNDVTFTLDDLTTGATQYIKQVRVRIRYAGNSGITGSGGTGFPQIYLQVDFKNAAGSRYAALLLSGGSFSAVASTYTGSWSTINPLTGAAWTDPDLDALKIAILQAASTDLTYCNVYEVYVDVDLNTGPTTVVTPPTTPVTSGSRPASSFTYTDVDGDAMLGYQVKIFDSAVYGAGGFDPATSTAVWDSGFIAASAVPTSVSPTVDLTNGNTYKTYVLVKQVPNSQASAWTASTAYVITLDAPAQPIVTATADDANAAILIAVQGRDNKMTKNQADLETDTSGWAAGANTTIARVTTNVLHGVGALQLASIAAGNCSATTPTGVGGFLATAGVQYTAVASGRRVSATNRQIRIDIAWYTAAGALISTTLGTPTSVGTSYTKVTCTANAPDTTAFITIIINFLGATAAAEQFNFDQLDVGPGSSTIWTRGGFNPQAFGTTAIVEYSLDGGTTWATVRGISGYGLWPNDQTTFGSISWYEAPPGVAVQFRARVSGTDSGQTLTGPNSATATATSNPTTATGWWLIDPITPANNQVVDIAAETWQTHEDEEQAIYKPLGRPKPLIVSDVIHGIDGTLDLEFDTSVKYQAFRTLRNAQHVVLLKRTAPTGASEQRYIRLGKHMATEERNTNPIIYGVKVDYVEVDAP